MTRDALWEAVWWDHPDGGPDSESNLAILMVRLRSLLPPGAIRCARGVGWSLDPAAPIPEWALGIDDRRLDELGSMPRPGRPPRVKPCYPEPRTSAL